MISGQTNLKLAGVLKPLIPSQQLPQFNRCRCPPERLSVFFPRDSVRPGTTKQVERVKRVEAVKVFSLDHSISYGAVLLF